MYSPPQQTLLKVDGSNEAATNMSEGTVTSQLRGTSRTYFYFTTATLSLCLVIAVSTIMVLVVQRTESIPESPDKFPLTLTGGNCSEDHLKILKKAPFNDSSAYLEVSKQINSSKLTWNQDSGHLNGIEYNNGNLVIQSPGLYFIYCHLHFYVPECPKDPFDLKVELLINDEVKKQTLVTLCESNLRTKGIFQDLFQFLLGDLKANNTVSIQVNKFQYVNTNDLPRDNVFGTFKYSSD
ncbi:tumor necrosis factor ligand superfamily member 8 [Tachyglossus aculeatus]|uniref:tumor necrosis factor ligand superfamily member 8 n=1 Tax=Tachyglossus aculeatus TaxID=9261 RepID=UPI0018F4B2D6|nr:tumor necrosis factor ligand superfamily member 8 [Tachyglossus aculeatus]